jgi:hypothetical protein
MITGSVASTIYGEPRFTHDIDMVIELEPEDAERLEEVFPIEEFSFLKAHKEDMRQKYGVNKTTQ